MEELIEWYIEGRVQGVWARGVQNELLHGNRLTFPFPFLYSHDFVVLVPAFNLADHQTSCQFPDHWHVGLQNDLTLTLRYSDGGVEMPRQKWWHSDINMSPIWTLVHNWSGLMVGKIMTRIEWRKLTKWQSDWEQRNNFRIVWFLFRNDREKVELLTQ